jgi:hypothetical protein
MGQDLSHFQRFIPGQDCSGVAGGTASGPGDGDALNREAAILVGDLGFASLADANHQNDGERADDDAQRSQENAEFVAGNRQDHRTQGFRGSHRSSPPVTTFSPTARPSITSLTVPLVRPQVTARSSRVPSSFWTVTYCWASLM